jgi:hypothetical protein
MLSQPIPLYLKQAFELLCFNHPYIDLFNYVSCLPLFSMMLLSERIYLWKLSMIVKSLLWLSMWFLLCKLWYKRLRSKYKYNMFIVLWPRTRGSCCLSWLVLWSVWCFLSVFCLLTLHSINPWSCLPSSVFAWGQARSKLGGLIRPFCITILYHNILLFIDIFHIQRWYLCCFLYFCMTGDYWRAHCWSQDSAGKRTVATWWWRQKISWWRLVDVEADCPCAWWLTSPLGTPRGRYDECSGKFSLS